MVFTSYHENCRFLFNILTRLGVKGLTTGILFGVPSVEFHPQCSVPGKGSVPVLMFAKQTPRSHQSQGWQVGDALSSGLVPLIQA